MEEVVEDPRYKNLRQEQIHQVQEGEGELQMDKLDNTLKILDNVNTWINDVQILTTVPKRH